jgi:hypothetical protein
MTILPEDKLVGSQRIDHVGEGGSEKRRRDYGDEATDHTQNARSHIHTPSTTLRHF